jgi:hypothetical protein
VSTAAPQVGHTWASGEPHSVQNFFPETFSEPQFPQTATDKA